MVLNLSLHIPSSALSNNVHATDMTPVIPPPPQPRDWHSFIHRQFWMCHLGRGMQLFIFSLHQIRNPKVKTFPALPEEERRQASNPFKHSRDFLSSLLPTPSSTILAYTPLQRDIPVAKGKRSLLAWVFLPLWQPWLPPSPTGCLQSGDPAPRFQPYGQGLELRHA